MTRFDTELVVEPSAIALLTVRASEFLRNAGVDEHATHHVALVLEEMLNNVGTHGRSSGMPATVRIAVEADRVRGEIIDSGPFFDPRAASDPDIGADVADRPIGGLGLFLTRRLASELDYMRREGRNFIAFSIPRK
jgi:anti-sigma regulatory factor (Ser/Thr protein kinase)